MARKVANIQRIVENTDGYQQRNRLTASLHQKRNSFWKRKVRKTMSKTIARCMIMQTFDNSQTTYCFDLSEK